MTQWEALRERQLGLLGRIEKMSVALDSLVPAEPAPSSATKTERAELGSVECTLPSILPIRVDIEKDLMGRDTPLQQRLRALCNEKKIGSAAFKRAPADYYDWSLEQRYGHSKSERTRTCWV